MGKNAKFQRKVEILEQMKGNYETKRKRALHQMNMSGDEWVAAKQLMHIQKRDVETNKRKGRR